MKFHVVNVNLTTALNSVPVAHVGAGGNEGRHVGVGGQEVGDLQGVEPLAVTSCFEKECTGLSKSNSAKFSELSINFPKLADWLCIFISRADRFESETQIKCCLLPALGFLERARKINHNRYSRNRKK